MLEEVIINCQQLTGLLAGSLSRNHVHRFIRIGRNLERADMTTRIVDAGSGSLIPELSLDSSKVRDSSDPYQDTLWMNVLRSLSAYQMYRQHVKDRVNAVDVVTFLLKDREFPRAVTYCLTQAMESMDELSNNTRALSQTGKALRKARKANIPRLLSRGLFQYIDELQVEIAAIHDQIASAWFLPRN
jgi:uncharacterized alpha-E superfamily protein